MMSNGAANGQSRLDDGEKNEIEEVSQSKWTIFIKQLWGPMPIMIWVATGVELALRNWLDVSILLVIQFVNAGISWYEITKAGDALAALKSQLKPTAIARRNGSWVEVEASTLRPGDEVLLSAGASVPADCRIDTGKLEVDQSSLTGESHAVSMAVGDEPKMGSTVTRGEAEATVQHVGRHTMFGRTATMLQAAQELGHLQKILLKIMIVIVAVSAALCTIAFIYIMAKGERFHDALTFVVILMIASIPIAIDIVCTATLALGSRQLSAHGAIVARLSSIEELAGMSVLCCDKTGTLTLNQMVIQEDCPTFVTGLDKAGLLKMAALAAKWRDPARDALDRMVLSTSGVDLGTLSNYQQLDYMPFDPTVKRTESTIRDPNGQVFKVTKGAAQVVLKLMPDKKEMQQKVEKIVSDLGDRGIRCLAVARSDAEGDWRMLGLLTFLDPPRPDTARTIHAARSFGVAIKMLTGDQEVIAKETARALQLGLDIRVADGLPDMPPDGVPPADLADKIGAMVMDADGFAQVYPEHKYLIVAALQQGGRRVGMTGDGVNDAPALKRANVGIAVSGSTDAARAAADIVLTQPGLLVIVDAIIISREVFQRIKSFINYRIAATLQLLVFFFSSTFALRPEHYREGFPSFFQMPVAMLMLITLLNDGTLISIAYDRTKPSALPQRWSLPVLFTISVVLGTVACLSSLLLLWAALDSHKPNSTFQKFGLPTIDYGQLVCLMYLKISLSDFLTLFSSRVEGFFWSHRPGWLLIAAGAAAVGLSTILACAWPTTTIDRIPVQGLARGSHKIWAIWVWLYCLIWWLIQDACKVLAYWIIRKFGFFERKSSHLSDPPLKYADPHVRVQDQAGQGMDDSRPGLLPLEHEPSMAMEIDGQVNGSRKGFLTGGMRSFMPNRKKTGSWQKF